MLKSTGPGGKRFRPRHSISRSPPRRLNGLAENWRGRATLVGASTVIAEMLVGCAAKPSHTGGIEPPQRPGQRLRPAARRPRQCRDRG